MLDEINTWIGGTIIDRIQVIVAIASLFVTVILYLFTKKHADKSEKREIINFKLSKLYTPLQNALEGFAINDILNYNQVLKELAEPINQNAKETLRSNLLSIAEKWWDFKDEYGKVEQFNHFASEDVTNLLKGFTGIFNKFPPRYKESYEKVKKGERRPEYYMDSLIKEDDWKIYLQNENNLSKYYKDLETALDAEIKALKNEFAESVKA